MFFSLELSNAGDTHKKRPKRKILYTPGNIQLSQGIFGAVAVVVVNSEPKLKFIGKLPFYRLF